MQDALPEILGNRYFFKWIGRCSFSTPAQDNDKVWGLFNYLDPTCSPKSDLGYDAKYTYVFWADMGKTVNFKTHINHPPSLNRLVMRKVSKNGYQRMALGDLIECWPNMYTVLNSGFVFYLLSEGK